MEAHLRKRILNDGSLSFADFMREALYHPDGGFYSRPGRVGKTGDFFTSVSVGPLFGELLASWVIERDADLGSPDPFVIIEQGAESGLLCTDIMATLRSKAPSLYARVQYCIIEPIALLQDAQRRTAELAGILDRVRWADSLKTEHHTEGVFLSNELVDSFPVHLVRFLGGEWMERRVGMSSSGGLEFEDTTPVPDDILHEIRRWRIPEIEGYVAEIHLEAAAWMRSVASVLDRGYFLTVDYGYGYGYGYRVEELYSPQRKEGTLQAYRNHHRSNDLLALPGQQDLTSHVHFDLLMDEGKQAGLETLIFQDQHHFLIEIARRGWLQEIEQKLHSNPNHSGLRKKLRAFQSLMHPEMMGTTFQCLVQKKG